MPLLELKMSACPLTAASRLHSAHMLTVASATVRGVCIDLCIMWWVIATVSIMFATSGLINIVDGVVDVGWLRVGGLRVGWLHVERHLRVGGRGRWRRRRR